MLHPELVAMGAAAVVLALATGAVLAGVLRGAALVRTSVLAIVAFVAISMTIDVRNS